MYFVGYLQDTNAGECFFYSSSSVTTGIFPLSVTTEMSFAPGPGIMFGAGAQLFRDSLDDQLSTVSMMSINSTKTGAMLSAYREKVSYWQAQKAGQADKTAVVEVKPGSGPRPRLPNMLPRTKRRKRERVEDMKQRSNVVKWWDKAPTVSGEKCTIAQTRLCKPEEYTGVYRRRFEPHKLTAVAGDYYRQPQKATILLQSRSYQELTQAKRAADFSAEVEWRMGLRPGSRAHGITFS